MDKSNETDALDSVPGTTVFTLARARAGRNLNAFCMALQSAEKREQFKSQESRFLEQFSLTSDQKEAVIRRDYNKMLALGGNIYCLSKIAAADGESFQKLASRMTGIPLAEFQQLMLDGGRNGVAAR